MSTVMVLDPFVGASCDYDEVKNFTYLKAVISKYELVYAFCQRLSNNGWLTEVISDDNFFVICRPPSKEGTEQELRDLLEKQNININDYDFVYFEDEEDLEDYDEEYFDDEKYGEEDFDDEKVIMSEEVADAIINRTIKSVKCSNFQVCIYLDDGKMLVYDEGFVLI